MTISKKNNRYYCRFQINGERYFRACRNCNTLNEARLFEADLIKKINDKQCGVEIHNKRITLDELMKYFLNYSFLNKKSYEQDMYRSRVILQYFGHSRYIDTIKALDIEQFKGFLVSNICSKTTANRYLEILSKMFNMAIDNEWLSKNPIKKNTKFRIKNYTVRYLTEEEEKRLFKYLTGDLKNIVIIALSTGLRKSNILNLKWENINLEFKTIEITENKSNKHLKIFMNNKLCNLFKSLPHVSEYVFINKYTKKPYVKLRSWKTALKKAGIENFRFHDLRHTVCTRLIKQGVPLPTVQQIMGHSSIQTTMRYNHIESLDMKNAMEIL